MDKYSHIILPEQIKASIKYSPRGSGGGSPAIPNRDRRTHAENLQHLLELAHSENERIKQEMEAVVEFTAQVPAEEEMSAVSAENEKS